VGLQTHHVLNHYHDHAHALHRYTVSGLDEADLAIAEAEDHLGAMFENEKDEHMSSEVETGEMAAEAHIVVAVATEAVDKLEVHN
jgi:hypothetical protein